MTLKELVKTIGGRKECLDRHDRRKAFRAGDSVSEVPDTGFLVWPGDLQDYAVPVFGNTLNHCICDGAINGRLLFLKH